MTPAQNQITIEYFLNNYINLTLGDLKLIFKRLIESKIYGSLSPNAIIIETEKYYSERLDVAEEESIRRHHEIKKQEFMDEDSDMMKDWYLRVKKTGIVKTAKEIRKRDDKDFQAFKAEYERNKILSNENNS